MMIVSTAFAFLLGMFCFYLFSSIKKPGRQTDLITTPDRVLSSDKEYIKEGYLPLGLFANLRKLGFLEYDVVSGRFNHILFEAGHAVLTGLSLDEYVGCVVYPDDRESFRNNFQAYIDEGYAEYKTLRLRFRTIRKEVNRFEWIELTAAAIVAANPADDVLTKVFGMLRIITSDVGREQELVNLRLRAEENDRLKSTFLANMSHEIRTPLNAIVGFSQLLPFVESPEEAAEYNRIIETNNELLLQLVNDILDISNIETNQMTFNFEQADLSDIFRQLAFSYTAKMPPNVELICHIPKDSYIIKTERNRLSQVITNFLNNARKFTTEGYITIGYTIENGYIRLFVRDTGQGIPEEGQRKVFERFVKLDIHAKGTGLGLSICQAIVRQFGGEIGVLSEPGKGSEFWFTIPLAN